MSARLFVEDVLFAQRLLSCASFDPGPLDGDYGPKTQAAEQKAASAYQNILQELGAYDPRSEKALVTLLPAMQRKARMILQLGVEQQASTGVRCILLSGTRTYAEQNRLYALRPKVTNAHGGQSNHNFGIAVDVGLFKDGRYLTGANHAEDRIYADFAALVKSKVPGIEWGGDWHGFPDAPHYQLATGRTLAEVRQAFEHGLSFTD